jgi:hypothetical protein
MFSIADFLDFDPNKNYFYKSRILFCTNGTILDITFKFMAGHNVWLIFDCFYASRKKRHLSKYLNLMCKQSLHITIQIELLYIDSLFSFNFSFFLNILFFLFFYFFFYFYNFVIISWIFVILFRYASII